MNILSFYENHPEYLRLKQCIVNGSNAHIKGLCGSAEAIIVALLANSKPVLIVLNDKEEASYLMNDLLFLIDESRLFFYPSSYKRPGQSDLIDQSGMIQRTELLNLLSEGTLEKSNPIIVTYPEALAEKVVSKANLHQNTVHLHVGEKISITFLKETLTEYHFERVDFVYEPGQYSVRGSIVDVFSYADEYPFRIDFFGDDVETIRSFNIETQLSVKNLTKITIVPDVKKFGNKTLKVSLTEFLPIGYVAWFQNLELTIDRIQSMLMGTWRHSEDRYEDDIALAPDLLSTSDFVAGIKTASVVECHSPYFIKKADAFVFNTVPQPTFNKNFEFLAQHLHEQVETGFTNYILSENKNQFERLKEIFASIDRKVAFTPINSALHEGFLDNDLKIGLYTDHQLFERYHKYKFKHNFKKSESLTISEINDLHPGDYVVHIDHGIGKFGGIEKVEINGRWQEVIKLVYKDNDVLYISIHSLHRISKFKSKETGEPKIYKLGNGAWAKLKATTKSKVKDIAKDLILLYARRKSTPGFQFSPDTYMQQELEASFIYEDTPDQEKATKLVKIAMERDYPMDMLVCGDVGFGKTEIAIRAAFKAVADSKQVAILVPTTILAWQHYKTFSERLKDFPCTVDFISRFKTGKEQKETLKNLEDGKTDILIGTHRLVASDIKFKELGLLIIDEEQKFGVSIKEKLKHLKANIDSLTLTATPIPRTLQFSLMGARDLAIINTPPPNRLPIFTELHTFSEEIIREGIRYEVARGGQVFFINNRVQNILEVQKMIHSIVPEVRTVVAHGQMEGDKLEKIMLDFINGEYDVFISTTIIESGLDIPNANTIFINEANHFGLSDLHQLRGRVGRSNKKAFCYLLAPPVSMLTTEARRRLKAIENFSDLGSGFNIAMQDLDIRGAGNLLGAEQSGFIAEIGFETYQRILNEAILELKDTEFKELFHKQEHGDEEGNKPMSEQGNATIFSQYVADCTIDTDLEIMIPEFYVENISERIKLYRELDNIKDEETIQQFEKKLIDRFGEIPLPAIEMMNVVRLRWLAIQLGFEKIIVKNGKLIINFVSNQQSSYYQSNMFGKILSYIQKNPRVFQMKEGKDKLSMSAENVKSIQEAIIILQKLLI